MNVSSSIDSQTPVARDNVTPREQEREISDPVVFSRVTEEKEEEEERTAPPSSPCHGFTRELARQILTKQILIHLLTVAAGVECVYMHAWLLQRTCLCFKSIYADLLPMCNFYSTFFADRALPTPWFSAVSRAFVTLTNSGIMGCCGSTQVRHHTTQHRVNACWLASGNFRTWTDACSAWSYECKSKHSY